MGTGNYNYIKFSINIFLFETLKNFYPV